MNSVECTPLVGLPQAAGWSQVVVSGQSSELQGVAVVAVAGANASNVGRELLRLMHQHTPKSFEQFPEYFALLEEHARVNTVGISFAAVFTDHKEVLFAAYDGYIVLSRQQKAGIALRSQPGQGLQVRMGSYAGDDVVVLATAAAGEFVSEIVLKAQAGFQLDIIVQSLEKGVHAQENSSQIALGFVSYEERLVESEDEPPIMFEAELVAQSSDEPDNEPNNEPSNEPGNEPDIFNESRYGTTSDLPADSQLSEILQVQARPQSPQSSQSRVLRALASGAARIWHAARAFEQRVAVGRTRAALMRAKNMRPRLFVRIITGSIARWRAPRLQPGMIARSKQYKKRLLLFMGIVLVVGAGLIVVAAHTYQQRAWLADTHQELLPITQSLDEASQQAESSPLEAREQVRDSIVKLEALEGRLQTEGAQSAARATAQVLEEARALDKQISAQRQLAELDVAYDLRRVRSDFVTTHTSFNQGRAAFYDADTQYLIVLAVAAESGSQLGSQVLGARIDLDQPVRDIALGNTALFILADGVHQVALPSELMTLSEELSGSTWQLEQIIAQGDSNREATRLAAYDRFVYVLNPQRRNMYRYALQSDGEYSAPIGWMQAALGLEYDSIASMSVDGDIWLGLKTGGLLRFRTGSRVEFSLEGMNEQFSEFILLYSATDSDELYVLEPSKRRLAVISKDNGALLKEFYSTSLAAGVGVFAQDSAQSAYVVSGSLLYQLAL